jgi:LysR family transcriptional regulator, hydrogen peroxide-inducible genes activator
MATKDKPAMKARCFDLRQLECFCAIARTGSFTGAAEEMGMAQPSLSEQLGKLEQALGAALFERTSRKVTLTPLGEALLPKARALLEDADSLPQYVRSVRGELGGDLRIGAIPTILPYFLAPALKTFANRYPEIDLHLREATTVELIKQVQDGVLDVALLSLPVEGAGLVMAELFREPLHLAVPLHHELAGAEHVRLRQVSGERLLLLKDGHCLREEALTACDRARAQFNARFEADQFATIFELIRSGFGVSIVPEMARRAAEGCKLIPIEPAVRRNIGYIRLEKRYVTKAVETFTGYLREVAKAR